MANLTLSGKVAIVTGASRGLGEGIAYELAKRGAKVMITFTSTSSQARADTLVARIASLNNGSAAASVRADLRLPESPAIILDATLAAFSTSTIDILVNNAGVEQHRPLTDVTPEDFAAVFDVNVRGALLMTRAVLPHLRAPGRIINVSSLGARRGWAGYTVYCASKAALEGFTRALAVEIGAAGHSVNAVAPGPTESDMLDTLSEEVIEAQKQRTPMQNRIGTADDIAQVVAWLAEEGSRWVTGQTISATGGAEMI
ncbi:NAD(P)-binding protein [Schizophyllum commune H4-8]|uniref:Ketoreductase domain-containing protein n=1 Tax=Schizophyllum commune (strain H4-8 / FGSC 9210) TaxID=578458 RepID=D8Q8A8_SCHCM|nr:NAD(P)-binding protein [Schizophyllum commune H4-8]KAI5891136.1 NAD(P)-binding protein [Schizophyllum commune H4-8]